MKELETLLNTLIDIGWKPWGEENVKIEKTRNGFKFSSPLIGRFTSYSNRSLREIVSLESGLWQFCMEKGLCRKNGNNWSQYHIHPLEYELNYSSNEDYQYRLIESALVPEEELAQFLIDNIKTK